MAGETRMGPGQSDAAKKQIENLRRRIRVKSAALVEFMNSEVGKAILEALEAEFYHGDIAVTSNTNQTFYNLGQRDVVSYLHQLQRDSER